ncbi:MAG: hypothetical protein JXO72_14545 [Vicinamibacteria bacterium]|nr:hypothetical protein [Vicinamibacteria bacterium]
MQTSIAAIETEIGGALNEEQRSRLGRGLRQAGRFWRETDGDGAVFEAFVKRHFIAQETERDVLFTRFESLIEALNGHMHEINRVFREQADLDRGPIMAADEIFAGYDPGAHVTDDFFENKLAFAVLLNFPLTTLSERLSQGTSWSRRQWAEARLAALFDKRVPADVNLRLAEAEARAGRYIAEYNIWMHHVLDAGGRRLFSPKTRLLSHWNLRDQIKAEYADPAGLPRQRLIQAVMERIIDQTIPKAVINDPRVDWNPRTNEVRLSAVQDWEDARAAAPAADSAPEPDTRYAMLLETFHAARMLDPHSPLAPTHIARRFDEDREIPEERVRAMFEQVLASPLMPRVAGLIEKRLGRPLEPFDIWYDGFRQRSRHSEADLDALVQRRYPTAAEFTNGMPGILERLGFASERARAIAARIVVDPARGSGHAMGAAMRGAKAHLRTRVGPDGMNYKGFNIALHEMGHNVEQTISLDDIDHTLLQGVPNTAFTEAIAFIFQDRDLEILGLGSPDAHARHLKALNDYWATCEIGAVALVDMEVWRYMYDHPQATPAALKQATIGIARDVWNRHYAPVFGKRDVTLLAVYSHMVEAFLYLPDYPIGHMIASQIERQVRRSGSVGVAVERMARLGRISPDLWMTQATGAPVGPETLLEEAEEALAAVTTSPGT